MKVLEPETCRPRSPRRRSRGSGSFAALPGSTYCFHVTVSDVAGNTSAPSAQRCTALPVDDRTLRGSGWARRTGRFGYYRGTYAQSSARGAKLTLAGVRAKRLALVAVTCPTCGSVEVLQGKKVLRRVNLAAGAVEHRLFPIATLGSVRTGAVTIRITSSRRPVIVDGLGVSQA